MKNIILGMVIGLVQVLCIIPNDAYAQSSCGSIISPSNVYDPTSPSVTTPITNCGDPFHKTTDVASPYILYINGLPILDGGSIGFGEEGISSYWVGGFPLLTSSYHLLYFHDGEDYRYINMDPIEPNESEYRALAQEFFPAGTDVDPYVNVAIGTGSYFDLDPDMRSIYWDYMDYVETHFVWKRPTLTPGTYTLVSKDYLLVVTEESRLKKLFAFFIPTAHAQSLPEYTFTITFTVTEPQKPVTGISNILFLPGIESSRLYTVVDGKEEKVWEPFGNDDVQHLRMSDTGESLEDVYTRDVVDEIYNSSLAGSVYKKFIQYLIDIDDGQGGPLVTTFPYDWRHDVFDIVEHGTKDDLGKMVLPTSVVASLAKISSTGKVTLIAHSNGGLLAKAIMMKLEEEGKTNLIDKIIFIATPHIGTPKALATIFHGYDQEHLGGLIVDDVIIRYVLKNMPGAYGLLPSATYINTLDTPIISFDDSSTTQLYRNAYGVTISNLDEYINFLKGSEGREDAGDRASKIGIVNNEMVDSALLQHKEYLDKWSAPDGVEVFNIVGTGLPTPQSIEYKGFEDVSCAGSICVPIKKIEPMIHFTRFGDGTVVKKSAEAVDQTLVFVDMKAFNESSLISSDYTHADITEIRPVQDIIEHILHGSSSIGIDFVSTSEPSFNDDGLDIYTIHSPAHIYLKDSRGNVTGKTDVGGVWHSEIVGSSYFEAGEVKYVLVPSAGTYTIVIEGEGSGVYTHTLTTLNNEVETIHHSYTAPITPKSIIQYFKTGSNTYSNISVDDNGDGVTDREMTPSGEVIEKEVSYETLEDCIRRFKLLKKYEHPILELVTQAKKFTEHNKRRHKDSGPESKLLSVVEKMFSRYAKFGIVNNEQYAEVSVIINKLIDKEYEKRKKI